MESFESLSQADASRRSADDLELLAIAAYMVGRDDDYVGALERAHHAHADAGRTPRPCAVRSGQGSVSRSAATWAGPRAGSAALSGGCLREDPGCVERGYLLIPVIEDHEERADFEAVYSTATQAAEIGERHRDEDLQAMAVHEQGRALVGLGRISEGLGLLDEVMVAVSGGQLSPIVTGLMYLQRHRRLQEAHALRRAREWTTALSQWCELQPEMVSFTGVACSTGPRSCRWTAPGATRGSGPRPGALCPRRNRGGGGPLPGGGGAPRARRVRRGRGGLSRGEPLRA